MTQNTKTCMYCGTVNFAHAPYCARCAQPLPAAVRYCEHCGSAMDTNAPFCSHCGAQTAATYAVVSPQPQTKNKAKGWVIGISLFLVIGWLIAALFVFVIQPALEENDNRDRDDNASYVDDGEENNDDNDDYGGYYGNDYGNGATTTRNRTTRTTTTSRTTARTANGQSENTQKASTISQITSALTDKGYSVERAYNEEGIGEELSGVSYDYCYYASRYFDEYGNLYAYDQDWGCEYVQIRYIVFDSDQAAENAYRKVLADDVFDGAYQRLSGNGYDRAWYQASAYDSEMGLHTLLSRQGNVLVLVHVNWDDFKDAGLYYDNAAYSVVEGLGF